jgi:hypothetical protein
MEARCAQRRVGEIFFENARAELVLTEPIERGDERIEREAGAHRHALLGLVGRD